VVAPKLFVFDVFGTLVDWRGSIAAAARRQWGEGFDGERFADAWRGEYQPSMERIRDGARGYVKLDVLHRENLDRVLETFGLAATTDDAMRHRLTLEWHRLDAWPDVREGLARLRGVGMVAPCSNGNIALMAELARHNGLHWDAIVGADLARDYKPKPRVYLEACEAFGLAPPQVMMVAAHGSDLEAASACGLRTAFVERPDEFGRGLGERDAPSCAEQRVTNLVELAAVLGG
jgi:2-haloacid dehalogenase